MGKRSSGWPERRSWRDDWEYWSDEMHVSAHCDSHCLSIYLAIYLSIHPSIHPSIYLACCGIVLVLPVSWYVRKSIYHKCQSLRLRLFAFHGSRTVTVSLTKSHRPEVERDIPFHFMFEAGHRVQPSSRDEQDDSTASNSYQISTKMLAFLAGEWRSE